MKKILFAALALAGTFQMAQANTLTINNLTNCTLRCGISYYGDVMVPPGLSTYTSTPGNDISSLKLEFLAVNGSYLQLVSGITPSYSSGAGMPSPVCPTPMGYLTLSWAQASPTANATMIIF
ncbi:hypothetical protein DBR32_02380 [Taibaiella sp. KBW10]|uniref:hypothetical protein n=1 Tax=Taibaiella sp. KBW10 TaxID=2153357 RepID=UPI000F5A1993|nr:hypothetical protein [Taibaiella sp. KBW10]RQO32471.1 hypothetical protein DBR32_02380 [Taibaiella sp. KBW10]